MALEKIKEKYEAERAKRLRPDMQQQYIDTRADEFPKSLVADPWIDYDAIAAQEPPVMDGGEVKVLIIGAGHNGLLQAYRMIEAGVSVYDMCIVEAAGGYGGTWYWNRYPGLMCDVEGYTYMPLLEEFGYMPKHRYSYGQEIRGQSERIARRTGVDERSLLGTHVDSQTWDEVAGRWAVAMTQDLGPKHGKRSITVKAQYVIFATGGLPLPKVPRLPGLGECVAAGKVKVIHTSRWDYEYTGGTQAAPDMVNLADKRVAVVGTGATAIQVVPAVAKWAKHLYVVQRTPSYVGPRGQEKTDPEKWKREVAYKKGWQKERTINFNQWISDAPPSDGRNLVDDGWTHTPAASGLPGSNRKGIIPPEKIPEHIDEMLERDVERTAFVRDHIKKTVKDAVTAEKLTPWYPSWCKRPTFHDDYLDAFNRDNVTLVDTNGKGMEGYANDGIVVNGEKLQVDVLILATGFAVTTVMTIDQTIGATVKGVNGRDLGEYWAAKDFLTPYMGFGMRDFPNMFGFSSVGAGASYNMTSMMDIIARVIAHTVATAEKQAGSSAADKVVIQPTREAQEKHSAEVRKRATYNSVLSICTPTYFTGEGSLLIQPESPEERVAKANHSGWGTGPVDWLEHAEKWMAEGIDGFEIKLTGGANSLPN
ncbi:hypothetical protein PpBr36_04101 [Pyricularia pennisetigena]|uniref:hypothetical protein n=1 Tax=Pyricularia pennisetigena TaxID=1578925 RepID=UPI0011517CB9|nr:hypothetical protein PpBr36_04101 [Pyricularia pennisetigena]TLS27439.1 hypothetical protein PpBr36_04101 [Pyricularia pennisetigena]